MNLINLKVSNKPVPIMIITFSILTIKLRYTENEGGKIKVYNKKKIPFLILPPWKHSIHFLLP